jgi:hypothetical protein
VQTVSPVDRLRDTRITCASSGRGQIFLGDADGTVYLIDKQLVISSFRAYEFTLTHMIQVPQTTFLVTAGSDEPSLNPIVRLFNLEKWSSQADGRKPVCSREIRCISSLSQTEVTCLAAAESLTHLAVGFADGTLIIHKGDVTRERQSKQRMVKVSSHPITGIEFGCVNFGPNQSTNIFVSTSKQILSYMIRKDRETRLVLDEEKGAEYMCSCLVNDHRRQEKLFVVGRKDAVYFYQSDERGPCFAFEGEKNILMPFRNYLIVIGKERAADTAFARSSPSFEVDQTLDSSRGKSGPFGEYNQISIYDLQNKFVAYTSPIPPVQDIVIEWGMIYVLAKDGRMFQLSEKDISSKLEVLFRKSQFSLASELAQNYNYGSDQLAEISKRYADHLYKNGDYDTAISQYCKTIGVLEPSYVIRKYLDVSRIQNLTHYLQQLISMNLGNEDHTTLLINCFAKLKDDAELSKLTAQTSEFDVETAIKVLRHAGFYDHAAQLAVRHSNYDAYFQIQLKDKNDVSSAMQYLLQNVRESDQLTILIKYGRILIAKEPQRTTELAKRVTCRFLEDKSGFSLNSMSDSFAMDTLSPNFMEFDIEDMLNIFVQNTDAMINFIEYLIEKQPSKTTPSFYNTILGLLMRSFNSTGRRKRETSDKVMRILQNSDANYDIDQILMLCAANSFDPGLLYLYRKSKNYRLLQQHFIRNKDAENVVKCCQDYGSADPQLWVEAVYFFRDNLPTSERQVATVLTEIDNLHLMQPLTVIDTLCQNDRLPLACMREYMVRFLTLESEMIAENEKMILQDKDETEKMRQAIDELRTTPRTFQAAKCSGCNKSLDVPSVHFYCSHSYHQSCFESYSAEHDSECPICLPENTKLLNLIRFRKSVKDVSQKLRQQLGRPESDVMSVVSSYLSKGVFGVE